MEISKRGRKCQCLICAWWNGESPLNEEGICLVCVENMKKHKKILKTKAAENRKKYGYVRKEGEEYNGISSSLCCV